MRRLPTLLLGSIAALALLVPAAHAGPSTSDRTSVRAAIAPPPFNAHNFTHPLTIDNRFLPFVPGTRYVLEGTVDGTPHRVVLVVTDLMKVVNGVRTAVLWDRDFDDGELAEAELAFQAQDDAGAVWNLGEYPELYENGQFVGAPDTWIAGVGGAKAGYHMLAQPRVGTPSYVQGSVPAIDFLDIGKVSQTGQHVCDGIRCYDDVLVVDETSPLDPESGHQLKYYAPGVGNIRISPVGGSQPESLLLVSRTRLTAAELVQARLAVAQMEVRAYLVSDVYRHTLPALPR
jgi:hypothetical protein